MDWTHADLCTMGQEALARSSRRPQAPGAFGPPGGLVRVLNACSGMFAPPREIRCGDLGGWRAGGRGDHGGALVQPPRLEVTSVDRQARAYVAAFAAHGWSPRHGPPQQCDVEELWRCFPKGLFDIAHVRNALDHTVRPMQAILELVRVLRPGGRLVLWHWRNEHPEAWKGLTSGPHQWAFELCPSEDPAGALACEEAGIAGDSGRPLPMLWNYAVVYNVTRELAGRAALLSARYEADPLADSSHGNEFVVLELRRLHY
mmetsp:Transcript_80284/g.223236  ORF Transcript_80284/g.223236 Transcript_80284/m.223236 type:complete len:259 (-) Transcript_80284:47-823(-)